MREDGYKLEPVGQIRSTLRSLEDAPRQGDEGAPDAWVEVNPSFVGALRGVVAGDELIDGTPVVDVKPVLGSER